MECEYPFSVVSNLGRNVNTFIRGASAEPGRIASEPKRWTNQSHEASHPLITTTVCASKEPAVARKARTAGGINPEIDAAALSDPS